MTSRKFDVWINRPLSGVFQYVADPLKLPEWGDGVIGARMISEGELGVGSEYGIKNSSSRKDQEFVNVITRYEPDQVIEFRTAGRMLTYTSTREFEVVDGGTRITETMTIERASGIFGLLHPLVVRIATGMHENSLKNLKKILES